MHSSLHNKRKLRLKKKKEKKKKKKKRKAALKHIFIFWLCVGQLWRGKLVKFEASLANMVKLPSLLKIQNLAGHGGSSL